METPSIVANEDAATNKANLLKLTTDTLEFDLSNSVVSSLAGLYVRVSVFDGLSPAVSFSFLPYHLANHPHFLYILIYGRESS